MSDDRAKNVTNAMRLLAKDAEIARLRAELAETEARGYRRGIEEAEKKCAAIAGDPRMYDAERRRGAGMCQAAIRALGEKPLTPPAPAGS